jgi:glycosyltransferase involved in cell wall biosynthesis
MKPASPKFISVILSTYNAPKWLEKSLWGYAMQSDRDFEVVIADDGSGTPD